MPAGTVGAAYAEQKHIDRTRKAYREQVNQDYRLGELITTLTKISGLEKRVRRV